MKVLFLASNPEDSASLNLESEITELQRRFIEAEGEPVKFIFLPRVRLEEMPGLLIRHKPDILHLSAHGSTEDLTVTKGDDTRALLTSEALLSFIRSCLPRVVYLNACNSHSLAMDLAKEVDVAIGSSAPITNLTARATAVAFYERLLMGLPMGEAFDVARNLAKVLQDATVDLHPFAKSGVDWRSMTLHRIPRLVAHFEPLQPNSNQKEFHVCFGVTGVASSITQLLIFTDDRNYPQKAGNIKEMCSLTHNSPIDGVIWSDDFWPVDGDMRMFAVGVAGDGTTFSLGSSVAEALEHCYLHHTDEPIHDTVRAAIQRLRTHNGSKIIMGRGKR